MIELVLNKEAARYSFIEVYKLVCEHARSLKVDPLTSIRLRPVLGLGYARTEVESVEEVTQNGQTLYYINLNLPGLYGSASPLPKFFTDELIHASHLENDQARVFLDLIHRRLYQILYRAKTRLSPHYQADGLSSVHKLMFAMMGLRNAKYLERFPEPAFLLRNINIFRHQKGTMSGLKQLLANLFGIEQVLVEQWSKRVSTLEQEQHSRLNENRCQLGSTVLLGDKVEDVQSKIRILVNGISAKQYQFWCLNEQNLTSLKALVKYFIQQPLLIDIEFNVEAGESLCQPLADEEQHKLGFNTWLQPSNDSEQLSARLKLG